MVSAGGKAGMHVLNGKEILNEWIGANFLEIGDVRNYYAYKGIRLL